MNARIQTLKADLQAELNSIETIYQKVLMTYDMNDNEQAIVVGYYLHNLYNAFECVFRLIADAFENHIPESDKWHSLLLERMGRSIPDIRPALLSQTALESLDELRRFRHLFRHLYRYDLKAEGVQKALTQAQRLRTIYTADFQRFYQFIDALV